MTQHEALKDYMKYNIHKRDSDYQMNLLNHLSQGKIEKLNTMINEYLYITKSELKEAIQK